MEKRGEGKYVEISDEDGQIKRIVRETGSFPCKPGLLQMGVSEN